MKLFDKFKIKKENVVEKKVDELNNKENAFSKSFENNISHLEKLFLDDDTFVTRRIKNDTTEFFIAYCDGVVNSQTINDFIIRPILNSARNNFV